MLESLKILIDSRLGKNIVQADFMEDDGFFIKLKPGLLYSVIFFLKNDPDVRITLLDQIIAIPPQFLSWDELKISQSAEFALLYQLKSLKLPYRVTLVIEVHKETSIPSIITMFAGSAFLEADLRAKGINIEEAVTGK